MKMKVVCFAATGFFILFNISVHFKTIYPQGPSFTAASASRKKAKCSRETRLALFRSVLQLTMGIGIIV